VEKDAVKKSRPGPAVTLLVFTLIFFAFSSGTVAGCRAIDQASSPVKTVPYRSSWGIYLLDLKTEDVSLIYSFPAQTYPSCLRLNHNSNRMAFAQKPEGNDDDRTELYTIGTDGGELSRLTDNDYWDLYPAWSPDDGKIAFLSKREKDLDIYVMDAGGGGEKMLYDSGDNDADIDWAGGYITFTSGFAIWRIADDGTQPVQVTFPPDKGQWGKANLPAGDYDPRFSPDGSRIAFERLENTGDPHGGYNIFVVNREGNGETRLTSSSYSQGLVNWSHSGEELVYTVAAIEGQGKYDIYIMNSDGTNNRNVTPGYFPAGFLCHCPAFSGDDAGVYFLGQWWEE
jgi:Tol biopolymer transport system component